MAHSTDEVALIILVALQAEQNREPNDFRMRQPLGILTKKIIEHQGWQELDFLQGWGLIMTEKLAEVQQHQNNFYATPTDAGRAFIESRQADKKMWPPRSPLFERRQWLYVIILAAVAVRLAMIFWKIDH